MSSRLNDADEWCLVPLEGDSEWHKYNGKEGRPKRSSPQLTNAITWALDSLSFFKNHDNWHFFVFEIEGKSSSQKLLKSCELSVHPLSFCVNSLSNRERSSNPNQPWSMKENWKFFRRHNRQKIVILWQWNHEEFTQNTLERKRLLTSSKCYR